METSIDDHKNNPSKAILHERLMKLIIDHIKLIFLPEIPKLSSACKKRGIAPGYDTGESTDEWDGDYEEENSNDCCAFW